MSTAQPPSLADALTQFETACAAPVVPGELPAWCQTALDGCLMLQGPLDRAARDIHPQTFREIMREDAGLATRVEEMRAADERLPSELRQLVEQLEDLRQAAEAVEPDEARLQQRIGAARDAGFALAIAVRKQEAALETWLTEALNRDRGDVD